MYTQLVIRSMKIERQIAFDNCGPHRAATYFCLESVCELGSLFRSLKVSFAVLPVPSLRRVAPNPEMAAKLFIWAWPK